MAGWVVDLMIEGRSGRLAVECEGDQWQGPDAFNHGLARLRMLERCGLPIATVRGSAFYRDPDAALEPLWASLKQYRLEAAPRTD